MKMMSFIGSIWTDPFSNFVKDTCAFPNHIVDGVLSKPETLYQISHSRCNHCTSNHSASDHSNLLVRLYYCRTGQFIIVWGTLSYMPIHPRMVGVPSRRLSISSTSLLSSCYSRSVIWNARDVNPYKQIIFISQIGSEHWLELVVVVVEINSGVVATVVRNV
jgi:hypothetical protein